MRVCGDLVGVSTRARLVPRGALLDQRNYGALLDQRSSPSADRVGREERAAASRSGEGSCGPAGGLDTCPARSSRGTTRPAEVRALLDQRDPPPADRVADEERGGVSRSGDGLWGLGCGLDTCPARSSRGTTRPAEGRCTTRPAEGRGTTRPAEGRCTTRPAEGRGATRPADWGQRTAFITKPSRFHITALPETALPVRVLLVPS